MKRFTRWVKAAWCRLFGLTPERCSWCGELGVEHDDHVDHPQEDHYDGKREERARRTSAKDDA